MMKRSCSFLAVLLVLSLLLTSCGFDLSEQEILDRFYGGSLSDMDRSISDDLSIPTGTGRDQIVSFAEMEYVRPDLEVMEAHMETASGLLRQSFDKKAVFDALDVCHQDYFTFYTMRALAEIHCYLDLSDGYWAEEYDFCEAVVTDVERMLEQVCIDCAESDFAAVLDAEYFGEGYLAYYSSDNTGYTDETYAALLQEEAAILAEYREIRAGLSIQFEGKETSYYELISDPNLTEEAYIAVEDAYYEKYTPIFGDLYIRLVQIRREIAEYCGYDSYEEYAFDWIYGRDYTSEEADAFVADIRSYIAPLYREILAASAWDAIWYDALEEADLIAQAGTAAEAMGGEIAEVWNFMERYDLYDVTVSPLKVDMSFQTYLEDYEAPFAFIKTEGYNDDILDFVHEFGHCIDAYVNYNDTYSLEVTETFSQAMEYLFLCYADNALSPEELENLTEIKLLDTLDTYAQQGSFADFERQIYSLAEEELTVEKINEISLQTAIDYGYFEEGYEQYYAMSWIDIIHFFEQPFYVISYCVSNDAAFQIYQMELEESGAGVERFSRLLPREYDGFLDTVVEQGDLVSPFAPGRMESTAETIRAHFS